jgi:hypothetical protein
MPNSCRCISCHLGKHDWGNTNYISRWRARQTVLNSETTNLNTKTPKIHTKNLYSCLTPFIKYVLHT